MDLERKEIKVERLRGQKEKHQKVKIWAEDRKTKKNRKQSNLYTSKGPEPVIEAKILDTYPIEAQKGNLNTETISAIKEVIRQLEEDISRIEIALEVLRERLHDGTS